MSLLRASVLLVILLPGCTKRVVMSPVAAMGPAMVVEQFMGAVNAQNYSAMGNLFGTKDGPISGRDPRENVEKQMFLLGSVLHHEDYQVQGERSVPGRLGEATQLNVTITMHQKKIMVPFVVVRTKGEKWLVECIQIENVTNPSGTAVAPCVAN
jgi:hypothetical protein